LKFYGPIFGCPHACCGPRARSPSKLSALLASEAEEAHQYDQIIVKVGPHRLPILSVERVPESDDYKAGHDLTGLVRWPVSSLVSGLLLRHGTALADDVDVLDLGCGTGTAGIAAAVCCRPRRVVLADKQLLCRELSERNARLQPAGTIACAIDVEAYGWEPGDPRPPERGAFGLVISSDCLYTSLEEARSFEKWGAHFHDGKALAQFVEMIDWCLAPGGAALIAFDVRNGRDEERAVEAFAAGGFEPEVLTAAQCVPDERGEELSDAIVLRCLRVGACRPSAQAWHGETALGEVKWRL